MDESLSQTFLTLIRQTLDPLGTSIHEAEAGIMELLQNPDSLNSLFEIFDSSQEQTIKTSALLYINRLLIQYFNDIPEELIEATKAKILEILQSEETSPTLNQTNIFQIIITILEKNKDWQALLDYIISGEHVLQQSFAYIKQILFPFYHDIIIANAEYLFNIFTQGFESGDNQLILETVSIISLFGPDKRLFPNEDQHLGQYVEFLNQYIQAKLGEGDVDFLASFFEIFDNANKLFLFPKELGLEMVLSLLQNEQTSGMFKSKCNALLSVYIDDNSLDDMSTETSVELLDTEIRFLLEYMMEIGNVPENPILRTFSNILNLIMEKIPINDIFGIFQERFDELYGNQDGNTAFQCIAIIMLSEAICMYPSSFIPLLETYFSSIIELLQSDDQILILSALVAYTNNLDILQDFSNQNFGQLIQILMHDSEIDDDLTQDCTFLISNLCNNSPQDPELCSQIVQQSMENILVAKNSKTPYIFLENNVNIVSSLLARNPEIIDESADEIYSKCNELLAEDPDYYYQLLKIIITTLEGLAGNDNFADILNSVIQLCYSFLDSDDMTLIMYTNISMKKIIVIIQETLSQTDAEALYVQLFDKLFEQCALLSEDVICQWQYTHLEALTTCIFISVQIHEMFITTSRPYSIQETEIQERFLHIFDNLLKSNLEQEIYIQILECMETICCHSNRSPNETIRTLLISISRSILNSHKPPYTPTNIKKLIEFISNILYYLLFVGNDQEAELQVTNSIDPDFLPNRIIPFASNILDEAITRNEVTDTITSKDTIDFYGTIFGLISKIPHSYFDSFLMERFPLVIEAFQCEEPSISTINLFINYLIISPDLAAHESVAPIFGGIFQQIQESQNIPRLINIIKSLDLILTSFRPFFKPFEQALETAIVSRLVNITTSTTSQIIELKENFLAAYALLLSNYIGENLDYNQVYQIFCANMPIEKDYSCITPVFTYINVFQFTPDLDISQLVKKLIIQLAVPPTFIRAMGLDTPLKLINVVSLISSLFSKFEDGGEQFIAETLQGDEKKIMYFVSLYQRIFLYAQQFTNLRPEDLDPNLPVEEYDLTGVSD